MYLFFLGKSCANDCILWIMSQHVLGCGDVLEGTQLHNFILCIISTKLPHGLINTNQMLHSCLPHENIKHMQSVEKHEYQHAGRLGLTKFI